MITYEIPTSSAAQQFQIALGDSTYGITLTWCTPANCWTIDIADEKGVPIVGGIALVTGCDLLEQYAYLGFSGGVMLAQTDHDPDAVPTYDNLGTTGHLYFVTVP